MRLPPGEGRLVLGGATAGIIAVLAVLAFWVVRGGGATQPSHGVVPAVDSSAAVRALSDSVGARLTGGGPLIGAFARRVSDRLAARAPSTKRLRGPLRIRALNVVWQEPDGRTFARAAALRVALRTAPLGHGDIVLADARLERPVVRLSQAADGRWNYEVVLADLLNPPAGRERGSRRIVLDGGTIADGRVDVRTAETAFELRDLAGTLTRIRFAGPVADHPRIEVADMRAVLARQGAAPIGLQAQTGALDFLEDRLSFTLGNAAIDSVRLADISGIWSTSLPGYGVRAEGRAIDLSLADAASLVPDRTLPDGTATFSWAVEPVTDSVMIVDIRDAVLDSRGSHLTGAIRVRIGAGSPSVLFADLTLDPLTMELARAFADSLPFGGDVRGTVRGSGGHIGFDVTAELTAPGSKRFSTEAKGSVAFDDRSGVSLRELDARFRDVPFAVFERYAPSLPLRGAVSGSIALKGPPGGGQLAVDARFEMAAGIVTARGTVDLSGTVPRYDLTGHATGVRLSSLLSTPAPPVVFHGDFSLAGAGVDPAAAGARLTVSGGFTGWRAQPGDTLGIDLEMRGGLLSIHDLGMRLSTMNLNADGRWRFIRSPSGSIRYGLAIGSLEPWGPYLPVIGDRDAGGTFELAGTTTGSLDSLRFAGTLHGTGMHVGQWRIGQAVGEYDVALGDTVPRGTMTATLDSVVTGTAGSYEHVIVDARSTPPRMDFNLRAERANGGAIAIVAEGRVPAPGRIDVLLRQADIDLVDQRWSLSTPATLRWLPDHRVVVLGFDLRQAPTAAGAGGGRITLGGTLWPLDRLAGKLETRELPVGELQRLFGMLPYATGRLRLTADVDVTGASPTAEVTFRLDQGTISGVDVAALTGRLTYQDSVAQAEAVGALVADGGEFQLSASLPMRFDPDGPRIISLLEDGTVSGSLVAEDVSIAPFDSVSPQVEDVRGRLNGRLTMEGTVATPEFGGQLALTDGHLFATALNQNFDSIAGVLELSGRRVSLQRLRGWNDGWAEASGTITFPELNHPVIEAVAHFDHFEPIGVDNQPDAQLNGELNLKGPLDRLVLAGAVAVSNGYVPIPQFGEAGADFSALEPAGTSSGGGWLESLAIHDLRVDVADDVWFLAEAARAQLGGQLTLNKIGPDYTLQGTLEGQRGSYTLEAGPIIRRFEIVSATVRFLGSPQINPAIDITARRVVFDPTGRPIDISVNISGTLRTPALSLASADAASVPQSELLSFLFFGRSTLELGGGIAGESVVTETFLTGFFSEFAGLRLEQALQDVGFSPDIFQIRFGPGGLGGFGQPALLLGWDLSNDFFLTVESGLVALFGPENAPANTWAVRLEWAFASNSSARLGWEPVVQNRFLRGLTVALPQALSLDRQVSLELRRRWNY